MPDDSAAATTADHGHGLEIKCVQRPEHQLGLMRVNQHLAAIEQADEYPPGTEVQRRRRRQQGGPGHARCAANHRHVAIAAFV